MNPSLLELFAWIGFGFSCAALIFVFLILGSWAAHDPDKKEPDPPLSKWDQRMKDLQNKNNQ
jgi:hypothetical protein